jgi:hypothetical protein
MDDARAIADAAYNLAICRATLGDYGTAVSLLDEAERESRRAKIGTANVGLALARIALLNGDPATAERLADVVLTAPDAKPDVEQSAQAHVLHGLAACDLHDLPTAKRELAGAQSLAAPLKAAAVDATVAALAGAIHLSANDFTAATSDFDREADFCRLARQYRDMERALANAGRAAAAAGNASGAADRLYRAARTAAARRSVDAPALATEANEAARAAGDGALERLTSSLQQSLTVAATSSTRPAID